MPPTVATVLAVVATLLQGEGRQWPPEGRASCHVTLGCACQATVAAAATAAGTVGVVGAAGVLGVRTSARGGGVRLLRRCASAPTLGVDATPEAEGTALPGGVRLRTRSGCSRRRRPLPAPPATKAVLVGAPCAAAGGTERLRGLLSTVAAVDDNANRPGRVVADDEPNEAPMGKETEADPCASGERSPWRTRSPAA